jgi:hypothetical protein
MQRQSAHTPSAVCPRMALVSADAHLPTHGGLTPAAPGTVRSCIANIVFSPADIAHQHKSGGRQPPVALINANATAIRTHTVGGLPTNGARVCRCAFAHPRRAYARRSWYCAFVHRKHRFFAGRHSTAHQHKSGGASAPRGANKRECNGNPHTHRRRSADEWRSCLPMRICPPTAG